MLGNFSKMFKGGIDYCVELAEKYGGAVRIFGPLDAGVS
jgi:hypothetical protein